MFHILLVLWCWLFPNSGLVHCRCLVSQEKANLTYEMTMGTQKSEEVIKSLQVWLGNCSAVISMLSASACVVLSERCCSSL